MKNLGKLLFAAAFAAGVVFAQANAPANDSDSPKADTKQSCCDKSCKMAKNHKMAPETAKTKAPAKDAKAGCGDCCKAH